MSPRFLSISKEEADELWCNSSALMSQRRGNEKKHGKLPNLKEYGILNNQP